jgi:hypothetical protein
MDHSQAVQQMSAERYLLDELTPDLREAFEEHAFDCPDCANDLRAGVVFIDEAKIQLPQLVTPSPAPSLPAPSRPIAKKSRWSFWWQPAFAAPAFATLLAVIGFQNLATIPTLRVAATQPRLLPWVSIHAGTRGAGHTPVLADRKQGAVLLIELPQDSAYTSYAFELYDAQGKRYWSQSVATPGESSGGDSTISLLIPGAGLQQGSYALAIFAISPGGRTEIDRHVFDIHFDE